MTADLIAFIRARLDKDAEVAQAATQETTGRWTARNTGNGDTFVEDDDGAMILPTVRTQGVVQFHHIARHDPARALRGIEAKRRIVALHSDPDGNDPACSSIVYPEHAEDCETLHLLATEYADHPDFDPSWSV